MKNNDKWKLSDCLEDEDVADDAEDEEGADNVVQTAEDDNSEASSSLFNDKSDVDLSIKDEGFDLYQELKAIHDKVHEYVLAGRYHVEDHRVHLNTLWIPDWMLYEKIIFNLPAFTNSDTENKGVPYAAMPYFWWNNTGRNTAIRVTNIDHLIYQIQPDLSAPIRVRDFIINNHGSSMMKTRMQMVGFAFQMNLKQPW